jgi:predicted RNA binding protein YcfA (HicA-like mRNA interferase family)
MNPVSGRDFAKILEKNGWVLRRVHGSHHIYGKESVSFESLYLSTETNF